MGVEPGKAMAREGGRARGEGEGSGMGLAGSYTGVVVLSFSRQQMKGARGSSEGREHKVEPDKVGRLSEGTSQEGSWTWEKPESRQQSTGRRGSVEQG